MKTPVKLIFKIYSVPKVYPDYWLLKMGSSNELPILLFAVFLHSLFKSHIVLYFPDGNNKSALKTH